MNTMNTMNTMIVGRIILQALFITFSVATISCPIGYDTNYVCATYVSPIPLKCPLYTFIMSSCTHKLVPPQTPSPSPKTKSPSPSPSPSPRPDNQIPKEYVQAVTDVNAHRDWHHVPPLKWNVTVANAAMQWASLCPNNHDPNRTWGENLLWASGYNYDTSKYTAMAVDLWYNEIKNYNFNNPGFSMSTGHFAQLVWGSTTSIGIAGFNCPGGTTIVVAKFYPPGNVIGAFQQNVFPH